MSIDVKSVETTNEMIIAKYIKSSVQVLKDSSLVKNNMDMFLKLMSYEDELRDDYINLSTPDIKIDIETVYHLTEDFIVKIDSSGKLLNEYIRQKTKFYFDGTINTAHNLITEFMRRWVRIQSNSNSKYGEYLLLKEFIPLYYSNAFIYYMKEKDVFDINPEILIAQSVKKNYYKDPNKCVTTFLTIWSKANNGEIGHNEIAEGILESYKVLINKEEFIGTNIARLLEYINNTIYTGELSTTFASKFAVALARCTGYTEAIQEKLFKLAKYIKAGEQDEAFIHEYLKVVGKTMTEFMNVSNAEITELAVTEEEIYKADSNISKREKIVTAEPGVKYLVYVEEETNWVKFLNALKRLWWKMKNKRAE